MKKELLEKMLPDEFQKFAEDGILDIRAIEESDALENVNDLSLFADLFNGQLEQQRLILEKAGILEERNIPISDGFDMEEIRDLFAARPWTEALQIVLTEFNREQIKIQDAVADELGVEPDVRDSIFGGFYIERDEDGTVQNIEQQ